MAGTSARKADLAPDAGPQKPWEPDVWSPRHVMVCRLHAASLSHEEIALATGFSKNKVSIILCDDRAKRFIVEHVARMADATTDLHQRIQLHAVEALNEIVDQMRNAGKDFVRQKAAFGLLDRAGYTPVQKFAAVEAPKLPEGLHQAVIETSAELRLIKGSVAFSAPPAEAGSLARADEPLELLEGDLGGE